MTRCELTVQNPRQLNRKLESSPVTVPAGETLFEIDVPLSATERLDPAVRLIIDCYLSRDGGSSWVHKHREYWDGQEIELHDGTKIPRPTLVTLNCPSEEVLVKLEVSKWPSP